MASESVRPSRLELVERFVNTGAGVDRLDRLAEPDAAREWLDAVLRTGVPVDAGSLHRLRELREALALTLLAHNGLADTGDAEAALLPLCEASSLGLIVGRGARPQVTGVGDGLDGFVNDILAAVAISAIDGSWERLKACAEPDCRSAYWDRTRNRSQRYCSAATCANRARQRAFRMRQRP